MNVIKLKSIFHDLVTLFATCKDNFFWSSIISISSKDEPLESEHDGVDNKLDYCFFTERVEQPKPDGLNSSSSILSWISWRSLQMLIIISISSPSSMKYTSAWASNSTLIAFNFYSEYF